MVKEGAGQDEGTGGKEVRVEGERMIGTSLRLVKFSRVMWCRRGSAPVILVL